MSAKSVSGGDDGEADLLDAYSRAIISVTEKVGPAVVAINVKSAFGESAGSGVFFAPDGYILSNAHVVRRAAQVRITLADGRRLTADVIGIDLKTDLAVVTPVDVPYAELGDSSLLRVGQVVIAIGNPLALGFQSVSTGVVSALGRTSVNPSQAELADGGAQGILTDVALNPGDSGGPLVSSSGKIIGINTAIVRGNTSALQGAHGLGFSVPIDTAKWVLQELMAYRRVRRPWLGLCCEQSAESD
ncbi:trypsin-like cysteine/serine peptidase domain-containing protein [Baffinella frigidus]|nr:trypsin-like cysteine/serine peptidase domain-containing protein [Cryptophyta sp. CCMP2293]